MKVKKRINCCSVSTATQIGKSRPSVMYTSPSLSIWAFRNARRNSCSSASVETSSSLMTFIALISCPSFAIDIPPILSADGDPVWIAREALLQADESQLTPFELVERLGLGEVLPGSPLAVPVIQSAEVVAPPSCGCFELLFAAPEVRFDPLLDPAKSKARMIVDECLCRSLVSECEPRRVDRHAPIYPSPDVEEPVVSISPLKSTGGIAAENTGESLPCG